MQYLVNIYLIHWEQIFGICKLRETIAINYINENYPLAKLHYCYHYYFRVRIIKRKTGFRFGSIVLYFSKIALQR